MKKLTIRALVMIFALPLPAFAKPKKKTYNNAAQDVFNAALRTARERQVVTFVDEKNLLFTFDTGETMMCDGFVANASVEPVGNNKSTLTINVQKKENCGLAWGAGDRMAVKFFEQVTEELARNPQQKVSVKPETPAVPIPPSPTIETPPSEVGTVDLSSTPPGGEVDVDGAFVGDAPASLKLPPGKHTIAVSEAGFKPWSRDLLVLAGSETKLNVSLAK